MTAIRAVQGPHASESELVGALIVARTVGLTPRTGAAWFRDHVPTAALRLPWATFLRRSAAKPQALPRKKCRVLRSTGERDKYRMLSWTLRRSAPSRVGTRR